jgi:solute carrier family 35, member C2
LADLRSMPGIILFTYHKYLKSLESTVPLDAHGNPLVDTDIDISNDGPGIIGLQDSRALSADEYTLVR